MCAKLKAAIIGMGEGFRHIEAYQKSEDYELVALCDIDPARIDMRMKQYNLPSEMKQYTDYRQIVEDKEIDVVSCASPDFDHAEQCVALMKAGKHVFCEKPMTLDLEEARSIVNTAKETQRAFMVCHPTRYTPAFVLARKMIKRGDLGQLFMVESEYAHNYRGMDRRALKNWRKDARRDPLLGGGCHAVDLIRWIADDQLEHAFAFGTNISMPDWPIEYDSYMATYKFKSGIIGKVMCSIGVSRPYTMRSVFYGTKGTIICDNTSNTMQFSSVPFYDSDHDETPFVTIPVEVNNHNVMHQVQLLADVVLRGAEIHAGAVEGARTVAACVAAIESAKTGKRVDVEWDF